jgi:hypothetical protein
VRPIAEIRGPGAPRRYRGGLALLCGLACASSVAAHDFWVQPNSYWPMPGAAVPITLQVGHGPFRQRSPIPLGRITRFIAIRSGAAAIDLRAGLHPGQADEDASVRLRAPGTYVLVLETDAAAQSHLPAIRYNDYLKVEGLTPALDLRARTGRTDADGSENYSRKAKALVQIGPWGGSQAPVTTPVGLSLEIVPEASPYAVPRPGSLPVRVIFEGRPLAGALVKLTNLDHDEAPVETHRTDATGRARFMMPRTGNWLVNVIWTRKLPASRETEFETTFSSLSFGFPAMPR